MSEPDPTGRNRLGAETSPYLLQHQHNPVDWWAWGEAALAEAKATGKPILLSVGYAACHWCHVMAHESFEDEATAEVMNALFVNIKVDREERPDIDAIYMGALHRLGEQGGWPLTMFLDSAARPFWGGTYFPRQARYGKPAFVDVLREVARIHREDPERVRHNAEAIVQSLRERRPPGQIVLDDRTLADLTGRMAEAVDPVHGGLKGAPKFPQWGFFWMLWRGAIRYGDAAARQAVLTTLAHICQGGIYDHLGGGFARYSVDERWLAPHFEKMLYDNALLIDLLCEVWRETGDHRYAARIEETVSWLEREMIAEGGGFAASLDADSEGEEGRFYVWTAEEIREVLGTEDAAMFGRVYDVTAGGNWKGHTILNRLHALEALSAEQEGRLADMRAKLLARRDRRVRPGWDDKVLADWNGLMIAALARAATMLGRADWLAMAERAFGFVAERMTVQGTMPAGIAAAPAARREEAGTGTVPVGATGVRPGGSDTAHRRLWHSYRAGQAKAPATASDYANMISGAIRLVEATGDARYLAAARGWAEVLDRHYWVEDGGGYATSAEDTGDVIVRMANAHDDATPNANAVMITNLVHLWLLTGEDSYRARAEAIPQAFARDVGAAALGHCGVLASAMDLIAPAHVVVVGGEAHSGIHDRQQPATAPPPDQASGAGPVAARGEMKLVAALARVSLPGALVRVMADPAGVSGNAALAGKSAVRGQPTAYVCVGTQCSAPVTDADALVELMRRARRCGGVAEALSEG